MTNAAPTMQAQFNRVKAMLLRCVNWSLQQDSLLQIRNKAVSGWSPAEHLEHVGLANRSILGALKGFVGAPEPVQAAEMSEMAKGFFAAGMIPRGVAKHPDFVAPQGVALDYLRRELQSVLDDYKAIESEIVALAGSKATVSHPILGPLTAQQWLRFVEIHTRHHLDILRDIAGASL